MEFSPNNPIVQLCLQGMEMEDKGLPEESTRIFLRAWTEATNDFEKFLAAYYLTRHQKNVQDKIQWIEKTVEFALKINDNTVNSALPALYATLAKCYKAINDQANAIKYDDLAHSFKYKISDPGPFYHGTKADLKVGDLLTPGGKSNYKTELVMNHIYFTALVNGAGLAAALAQGDGRERVYIIEPTGKFENDPNVTDKKFPGNPTRSYRSESPLKITGELTDWVRQTPEQIRLWKEKLAASNGDIIN